jgi:hypothetical protein
MDVRNKKLEINEWIMPRCDSNGQWWHKNKKVIMIVLSNEEKDKYIKQQNTSV